MSPLPPVNTAAPTSKMAAAAKRSSPVADEKANASKMHKRSRSGCFTCRLRRKKCEEGKPRCKACSHLGLRCEYKRPQWWSNGASRRDQKELIKNIIRRSQLAKKSSQVESQQPQQQTQQSQPVSKPQQPVLHTNNSPPDLSHSVPSSAEAPFADQFPSQSGCKSEGSPYSTGCDFPYATPDGLYQMPPPPQPYPGHPQYSFSPYEVDIKTERQIFINDVPTRRDSTISTFSTFQPPHDAAQGLPADSWIQQEYFESTCEEFPEEPIDLNFFDYPHGPMTPDHETIIKVEEGDKELLTHFLDSVLKLIFPVLDANQHGSAERNVVLPALETNQAYLHCCLSTAATHMGDVKGVTDERMSGNVLRHRFAAISSLCEALQQDTNHAEILEATLAMIFFQCSVGRPSNDVADIPWHQHFEAAANLVNRLELPVVAVDAASTGQTHPSFNMTLTAWIDILGATIMGRPPVFADTYRELHMRQGSIGLTELMGCDDKIMFLVSEIACLDVQRNGGLNEVLLCQYVEVLAKAIGETEPAEGSLASCFSPTGAIRPKQLAINITAVFRIAARIYLCTLVPGYATNQPSICHLIEHFCRLMDFIPAGPDGFDRSLAWPMLVAGSASVAGSPFRAKFAERCDRLGDAANFGSIGRIRELLCRTIWPVNDAKAAQGDHQGIRWRDAMQQNGWETLLI